MRYFYGVGLPLLMQCAIIGLVILTNQGNGSWVGLAVFLIGIFAVPVTAIINFLHIKAKKEEKITIVIKQCFAIAAITPAIVLLLMIF